MSIWKNVGRVAAGVGTLGISEAVRKGGIFNPNNSSDAAIGDGQATQRAATAQSGASDSKALDDSTAQNNAYNDVAKGTISTFKGKRDALNSKQDDTDAKYGADVSAETSRDSDVTDKYEGDYRDTQGKLLTQSQGQLSDASTHYKQMDSDYKDLQDQAKQNSVAASINAKRLGDQASTAMTWQEAADPNNKVAQDTRGLYENQAQNEGKQGLSDYGVLASLGQQAASNQIGASGAPMSIGQQVALQSMANGQASQAYNNTQQRMQSLRDQGLNQGFVQSQNAFNNGQTVNNSYQSALAGVGSLQQGQNAIANSRTNARNAYDSTASGLTDQQTGLTGNIRDSSQRAENIRARNNADSIKTGHSIATKINDRGQAAASQDYGLDQGYNADANNRQQALIAQKIQNNHYQTGLQMGNAQSQIAAAQADKTGVTSVLGAGAGVLGQVGGAVAGQVAKNANLGGKPDGTAGAPGQTTAGGGTGEPSETTGGAGTPTAPGPVVAGQPEDPYNQFG